MLFFVVDGGWGGTQHLTLNSINVNDAVYAANSPLPAALPLFSSGLGVLAFLGWRKKRKRAAQASRLIDAHERPPQGGLSILDAIHLRCPALAAGGKQRQSKGGVVPKSFFLVRAVVVAPLRDKFDHWYSTDHLPLALKVFKCEKAWRFWSEVEEGMHYAVYQFADKPALDAALARTVSRPWSPISTPPGRRASPAPAIS